MKVVICIVALVFCACAASAMSFWSALAEIESGGNDYAVGSVGEVSRYQIRPEIWEMYSSSRRYADPRVALPIAEKYMAKLKRDFERETGRAATEADCVILWKSGITGYEKRGFNPARMSAAHHDRIIRFRNLRGDDLLARAPAQKPAPNTLVHTEAKPAEAKEKETPIFAPIVPTQINSSFFYKPDMVPLQRQPGNLFAQIETFPDAVRHLTLQ